MSTSRSELEARIASRLATLSEADAQRLAEDYAHLRFPDRFPHFDFRALSPEGKTRGGWPDAYCLLPDGGIDGVEATSAKGASNVREHLREDLEKAVGCEPPLGGFVFVSIHPSVQMEKGELEEWRRRFAEAAKLEVERVELVFGGRLVRELAGPEFARTRSEILQLAHRPRWFELVRPDLPPGEGQRDSAFIPTPEDYAAGRVHRPAVADEILAALDAEGRVLARGVGASGKTVMAWLLALQAARDGWPAYYLDLVRAPDLSYDFDSGLAEDLRSFGHPRVLFVLDNVHLDERLAKKLALDWEDLASGQRPRLLLLRRELRTGRGSPIEGLPIATFAIRARQEEVLGVYRRLAGQAVRGGAPPQPPSEVLDAWVATFGGDPSSPETTTDLIAFSAAVSRRLSSLLRRDWVLSEADAIEEVREAYLDALGDGETRNLLRLCALADLEIDLPEPALVNPRAGLRVSSERLGLVFRVRTDRGPAGQHANYRLAHAALGRLIRAATYIPVRAEHERRAAAAANPIVAFYLIRRLAADGDGDEAREVASTALSQPVEFLLDLPNLTFLQSFWLRAEVLAADLEGVDFSNQRERLGELAQQARLDTIPPFLSFCAERKKLAPAYEGIVAALSDDCHREQLVERALQTPLQPLASFLSYSAGRKELEPAFEAIAAALGDEVHWEKLVERALQTPLGDLAGFLSYCARTNQMKGALGALASALAEPQNRRVLAGRVVGSALDQMVAALSSEVAEELWSAVLKEVDADEWFRVTTQVADPKLDAFVSFQRIAGRMGRAELAEGPALSLVRRSVPRE